MSSIFTDAYYTWKAQSKDPESFAKIYDMYIDKIYRFIYFKVSDKELAQDLAAEVFLKTWEYVNTGKEIDNIKALLYKISRNLIIDYYRSRHRHDVSIESEILENIDEESSNEPEIITHTHIDIKMELEVVEKAIKSLKDEYKDVLLLKHIEELSLGEIAKVLQKKNGAVRVMLHRATKALQEILDKNNNG